MLPETPVPKTSREHAEIWQDVEGKLWLYDKSSNGTLVAGSPVPKHQPYPIRWGDPVVFADEVPLDWGLVVPYIPRPVAGGPGEGRSPTQFRVVAMSFMKSMLEWEDRVTQFGLFLRLLPNPSTRLVEYFPKSSEKQTSPVSFFLTALTLSFFTQEFIPEEKTFDQMPGFLQEFLVTLLIGVVLLVTGYVQYKVYNSLTNNRGQATPRRYFNIYLSFYAFYLILISICSLPVIMGMHQLLSMELVGIYALVILLPVMLWIFHHYIRLNHIVWQISYWRSLWGVFLVLLIYIVAFGGLAVAIAAMQ